MTFSEFYDYHIVEGTLLQEQSDFLHQPFVAYAPLTRELSQVYPKKFCIF
jgi:hypothetical protein